MSRYVLEEEIIETVDMTDSALAVTSTRLMCARIGFDEPTRNLIATGVSELATNVVKYGRGGSTALRWIRDDKRDGIEIEAVDSGPGIPDVDLAMTDNYSTQGTLGMGLPGVKRIMDEFTIETESGKGTRCIARKWR